MKLDGHEECETLSKNGTFCIHFWTWGTRYQREKPRDEIDMDPIWQLSRLEGPYLDTFRPTTDPTQRGDEERPAIIVTDHDRDCFAETPCESCIERTGEHIGRLEPRVTQDICSMQGMARDLLLRIQLFKIDYDAYASLHMEVLAADESTTAARLQSLKRIRWRLAAEKEEIEGIMQIRVQLFNIEYKELRTLQQLMKRRKSMSLADLNDESRLSERLLRLKDEIDAEIHAAR